MSIKPCKFWHKKKQEMIISTDNFFDPKSNGCLGEIDGPKIKEDYEVLEYSGYNDMNNERIFQGDICECWISENPHNKTFIHVVTKNAGKFGYKDWSGKFHSFDKHKWITKPVIKDWKVIGNIYQNPLS